MARTPDPKKKPQPEPKKPMPPEDTAVTEEDVLAQLMGESSAILDSTEPPSSAVNLGQPGGPSASPATPAGDSFEWASLADRPALSSGGGEPARFDSPSDVDVLYGAAPPSDEDSDISAMSLGGADSSRVDLSEPPPSNDPLASRSHKLEDTHVPAPRSGEALVPPAASEDEFPSEEPPDRLRTTMRAHAGEPPAVLAETVSRRPADAPADLAETMRAPAGALPESLPKDVAASIPADSGIDLGSSPWPPSEPTIDIGSSVQLIDESGSSSSILVGGSARLSKSDSALDLGAQSAAIVIDSSTGLAPSGVDILPEESSASDVVVGADSGISMTGQSGVDIGIIVRADSSASAPPLKEGESGIDLGPVAIAALEERPVGNSGLDLRTAAIGEEPAEAASGLDLETVPAAAEEANIADEPHEEGGSAVDLGAVTVEGSDRDLIAEAVESGVDLARTSGAPPESGSYAEVVIGDQPISAEGSSSAVDLGASVLIEDEPPAIAMPGQAETIAWDSGMNMAGLPAAPAATDEDTFPEAASHAAAPSGGAAPGAGDNLFTDEGVEAAEEEPTVAEAGDAEDEAVAAEEEEEETLPATRPMKPKYGRRWAGGILVGSLIGAAACVGVLRLDVVPKDIRGMVLGEEKNTDSGQQQQAATSRALLDNADWTKAAPAPDAANKEDLVNHGRFVFLKYLYQTAQPKAAAPEVQQALQDFQAAASPEGIYWQGYVHEKLGNSAEARKLYEAALKGPEGQPPMTEMFESAIHRLELQGGARPAIPPAGAAPRHGWNPILLFTLVQPMPGDPQPMPPAQPPDPSKVPEAGFAYWSAVRLAQQQKYPLAIAALAEARKRHNDRRIGQLMKAQNPISDPTEDMFLRACDELKAYFELQEKLASRKYLDVAANKTDPVKAVDALLKDATEARTALADLQTKFNNLDTEKKKVDAKVIELNTDLTKSKKETADAKTTIAERDTMLTKAGNDLKAEQGKLAAMTTKADGLETEKKALEDAVRAVAKTIGFENLNVATGKPMLFAKLVDIMAVYTERDPGQKLTKLADDNRKLTAALAERWTPDVMLSYWQSVLQDRGQKALTAPAVKDAERARANAMATAETKALAAFVEALAARNQGDAVKAREKLAEALKDAAAGKDRWRKNAEQALVELTDPAAYYLPRAEALRAQKKYAECVASLDEALKVFTDKNGKLLALRANARLDAALEQTGGKVKLDSPGMAEAAKDAADASAAGAKAEGAYALGRLYEAVGQAKDAADQYREAVKAAPADSIESARYRLALARVLLQVADATKPAGTRLPNPRDLLEFSLIALQPPPPQQAALDEATREAEAILKRPDIDQHPLLKAQALAIQGLATEALNTYVAGLKPHLNAEQHATLKAMLDNHPMQRQPDRMRVPHPFQAQRFYTSGIAQFHAGEFFAAEQSFTRAIEHFDQDARYYYFLGLARMKQGKVGVPEAFYQAALLEFDNRPSRDAVDASLERIQGPPRRLIDAARSKAR